MKVSIITTLLLLVLQISFTYAQVPECPFDESVFSGTLTVTTAGAIKIKASDATSNHRFGERVAIDGNIAAVASRSNGAAAGKVYIFTNDGAGNWSQQTILNASDGFAGDNFGSDIALEGNYLVVGARSQLDTNNVDTGAAYLFEYNGVNTWTEVKKFEPSDGLTDYRFGESVAIEGDLILIGARKGCIGGCAYLYENDGTNTFTYTETKLEPQVQSGYDGARFGNDVRIKDGRAYVGGPYDFSSVGRASAGSVQVWDQANDGTWSRTHRLRGTETSESFGWAIDVEGEYLAIGAMNFETSTTAEADQGRVFVYKADANGDYLEANRVMIQNDDKDSFTDQRFGTDVVLENGYLYVGTWGDGTINGDAVYIFQDDGTNNWTQIAKITSGAGWDEFSNRAVAVSFPNLLIGQNEDDSPSNSGSVYFVPLANQVVPVASVTETVGVNTTQNNGIIKVSFDDEATETQIKFSVDGGSTYPYLFDDTLGNEEITNLAIGTYDVWVAFDENSCPISLGSFDINEIAYTNIPDTNFEAALEALGYDDVSGDGQVPTSLIEVVTDLNVSNDGITDLTGIEDFTALVDLRCHLNNLTTLDISNNANLEQLRCYDNPITSLDVSSNAQLSFLNVRDCSLTSLDVTNNTLLTGLKFFGTTITTIDLSQNILLEELDCKSTSLVSLDLSNNTALTSLIAYSNASLSDLNVKNGNNTNVTTFETYSSPNLSCIIVDDVAYSTTNWTDIDGVTSFTDSYCRYTAIPDTNFEAALEALGYDDISGDGQVPTALIEVVTSLNITNDGITDLTGIEDFRDLTNLLCSNNPLGTIDISNNTNLIQLNAHTTSLSSIDLSNNVFIENVVLYGNAITSIDVSNNLQLRILDLFQNQLTSLDLSLNTALVNLYCDSNNNLSYLNVRNGNNTNVTNFVAHNNSSLTCILVDDAAYSTTNWTSIDATAGFSDTYCLYTAIPDANFEAALDALGYDDISSDGQVPTVLIEVVASLDVGSQSIADLTGIEDFAALERLTCHDNSIQNLDLTNNSQLEYIKCNENGMDNLNLTGLTNFEELIGYYNDFTSFDFSGHPNLHKVSLFGNSLTSLDLSNNPGLLFIRLDQNNLTHLDVKNGTNTNITFFNTNSNSNLTCILVDDAAYSTTNWTNINGTTSFSNTYCLYTAIPDTNFEAALEALGYDDITSDGQVPTALIEVLTSLDVSGNAIVDMTGIEDFVALEDLNVINNSIANLNLSNNLQLKTVDTENNPLVSIDVSQNTLLEELYCEQNQLTTIDISNNLALRILDLDDNNLSSINVSVNTALTTLDLSDNAITNIDISSNILLDFIGFENNGMTGDLNLENHTQIVAFAINDNNITSLNIQNGANNNIIFFNTVNNPNLTCIVVDDTAYSTTNWTNIDVTTGFSDTYCRYTTIPDADFEAALEAFGYDDISGDGQVPTALIEVVTSLNLNGYSVSDLTGIEDFTAIKTLNCRGNNLTSIDVSNNLFLDTLWLANNSLSAIDVSNNPLLEKLEVTDSNLITSLDLSNNPVLELLEGNNTSISSIDFSNNLVLEDVDLRNTQLTSINVSLQTALVTIKVSNNPNLSYLNVKNGNNINVTVFQSASTPNLSCILADDAGYSTTNWTNIDGHTSFSDTYCEYTAIPDSNFESALESLGYDDISGDGQVPTALIDGVTSLTTQFLSINDFTGIEDFIALESLTISYNNFSSLDVSNNTNLTFLNCGYSNLTSLDVSNNVALETLWVNNTSVSSLNLELNTNLTSLTASSMNNLTDLNIKNGNNTNVTQFTTINSTNLSCIFVDDPAYSTTNWTDIEPSTFFSSTYCVYTAVPDTNFEAALEALGYDDISGDGQVPTAIIEAVTSLNVSNNGITDLTGIEDFIALTTLNVSDNTLGTIGITNNINLQILSVSGCSLTSLDISQNIALQELYANSNFLTSLDTNTNTLLKSIVLYGNLIATADFSTNTVLETLDLFQNNLTTLDVSNNTILEALFCDDNELTGLNLQNGNNTSLASFNATNNAGLSCILVDDVAYATTNLTNIDGGVTFSSTYCRYTAIPDANFEAALEALGYDDITADGQVPTVLIETITTLSVLEKSIADLTGIADFVALTSLDARRNDLTSLDVSNNTLLETLLCQENNVLASLNVSNNPVLSFLVCDGNHSQH